MRNRPSRTAIKVARGVIWMENVPRFHALLPAGTAERTREVLTATGHHKRWHDRLLRRRWHQRLVVWSSRKLVPGQLETLALRKRLVQDEVCAAIAEGTTQVLVVGAGFDTLALRLAPEHAGVSFFEVDHPPTQAAKRTAIEKLERPLPNLHFVPADLSKTTLGEALGGDAAWSSDARTIAIAEGVLMYLAEADVVAFFEEVRRVSGTGSRVVFSHVRRDERGRADLGRLGGLSRGALRLVGEPMRWAISDLDPFLAAHGIRRLPPSDRCHLAARYRDLLGGREIPPGIEFYAVVDFAG